MSKRQFGTIRKLPSGRWQARYPDGSGRKMPADRTFPTKADAARFLASVQTDMGRGQFLDPREGRITLAQWSEEWLALPGKRPASIARDRQGLEVFLPDLGVFPLSAITPKHVQAAVNARAKEAAPSTLARDFSALRAVLNAAVDADRIARSPARKIALPTVRTAERATVTPEGLSELAEALPGHYRALVLTGAVLGLRWGEAIGLRVCDIDFPRRSVTVAGTVKELAGHLTVEPDAKTAQSLRSLVAPAFLIDELALHLALYRGSPEADSEALVFVGPKGGILRRRFVERILRPTAERIRAEAIAGGRVPPVPEGLTFHALRHVAVTAMADAGVPYNVTQRRAGHSTARMTMERYSHRSTEADKDAAAALQGYFSDAFSEQSGTDGARHATGTPFRKA
jgi:integrase